MNTGRTYTVIKSFAFAALCLFVLGAHVASAEGCHYVKGKLRGDIAASMNGFIEANTVDGTFYMYDALEGKLLRLKFAKLHEGVMKKGEFFVSCADFTDGRGTRVDLDFMVVPDGERYVTTQAVIHSVDGKKRKYHLE